MLCILLNLHRVEKTLMWQDAMIKLTICSEIDDRIGSMGPVIRDQGSIAGILGCVILIHHLNPCDRRNPGRCYPFNCMFFVVIFFGLIPHLLRNPGTWINFRKLTRRFSFENKRLQIMDYSLTPLILHWLLCVIKGSVQCTVYSVQYTVYTVQCAVYSVQCTVYSVECTVYSVHSTVYSVQCTVYSVQHTVKSAKCPVYSVHYPVSSVQCTVSSVQWPVSR